MCRHRRAHPLAHGGRDDSQRQPRRPHRDGDLRRAPHLAPGDEGAVGPGGLRPGDRARPQRRSHRATAVPASAPQGSGGVAALAALHGHRHGVDRDGQRRCSQPAIHADSSGGYGVVRTRHLSLGMATDAACHSQHGHPRGDEHDYQLRLQFLQHLLGRRVDCLGHGVAHLL